MSIIQGNIVGGGAPSPYSIDKSLRFRSGSSPNLQRTFSGIGYTQATISFGCKRSTFGTSTAIIGSYAGAGDLFDVYFTSGNLLGIYEITGGSTDYGYWFSNVYRDPAAHMQVVIVIDTPNAVASERLRCYVNGVRLTAISTNHGEFPQNYAVKFFRSGYTNYIGYNPDQGGYFDGYLSEFNFIDGLALDASYFGEVNTLTQQWNFKKYTGIYGANGFYLDFKDPTNLTTLCSDKSGNGNNWTSSGISLTAGANYDCLKDTPTNNFPTINPLYNANAVYSLTPTIASGALVATGWASSAQFYSASTFQLPSTGKYYAEFELLNGTGNATYCGLSSILVSAPCIYSSSGNYWTGSYWAAYGSAYTTGDIIGVEVNVDAGIVEFFKGEVSQGTRSSSMGEMHFFSSSYNPGASHSWTLNYGQRPFARTPTTGFLPLCSANMPDASLFNSKEHFDIRLLSGTGGTQSISGLLFSPGLVWSKSRNSSSEHGVQDIVRGINKELRTNSLVAEVSYTDTLTAFNSDGVTFGADASTHYNASGQTYVDWMWRAGSSIVSNTAGSITSQVSSNTTAGFSIVKYTGNGINGATIGHGLGKKPNMLIVKCINTAGYNWYVYTSTMTATAAAFLDSNAAAASVPTAWNNTEPTTTVFSVGNNGAVGFSGYEYIAYAYAEVPGYSKVGQYVGNGSTDGAFIYCGFRPRYIMIKCISGAGSGYDWIIQDTERSKYNVVNTELAANLSSAETPYQLVDIVSNGFKHRYNYGTVNANGATYIYYAVAETPFQYANAR